jgi:hypothetical protein
MYIWAYSDGSFSECDTDGNHDDIDADDVPSADEVGNRWRDYSRYVIETGEDPLREFFIKRETIKREIWYFRIVPSILGACVKQARHGKRSDFDPRYLPQHVAAYLNAAVKSNALQDFPKWKQFEEAFPSYKPGTWMRHVIEHLAPRDSGTIARELQAAARRHLKRSKA